MKTKIKKNEETILEYKDSQEYKNIEAALES